MSAADGVPRPVFASLEEAFKAYLGAIEEAEGEPVDPEVVEVHRLAWMHGATAVWAMVQTMPKEAEACADALGKLGHEIDRFCDESEARLLESGATTRH